MTVKLYSIRDCKAGFGFPFSQQNDEVAMRTFEILCADPQSEISKCPNDYEIWCVGEFNSENGSIDSFLPTPLTRKIKE